MARRRSPAPRTASLPPAGVQPAPATQSPLYVEALAAHHARGNRVADALVDALIAAQRDALALGVALAADPTAFARHAAAFLGAVHEASARAWAFATVVARAQSEAATELQAASRRALGGG